VVLVGKKSDTGSDLWTVGFEIKLLKEKTVNLGRKGTSVRGEFSGRGEERTLGKERRKKSSPYYMRGAPPEEESL